MFNIFFLGNASPKKYIPPSEQTVQEPKKYTGGAIPSRSFKILQAMTSPDACGKKHFTPNQNKILKTI